MSATRVFTPSPEQAAFLDWIRDGRGSVVLEAVAGAGKTTTLTEGVRRMKGSVHLLAFNNKMGKELKARIEAFEDHEKDGKRAGTFHSAGLGALRYADKRYADRKNTDKHKVRDLTDEMLRQAGLDEVSGLRAAICQLVSLAKQTGFYVKGLAERVGPAYWSELIYRHDVLDKIEESFEAEALGRLADTILQRSTEKAKREFVIDFDDMIYLPLLWNLRFFRNDWVLIDEAQDTNPARREMARRMLRAGGRLGAVGDPHQAIYGFTGADNRSLDLIREAFDAKTLALSVSWRCPTKVVEVAREYVGHINAAPTAPSGEHRRIGYREMLDTVSPGQAVLCRFNAPLVDLCFRLIREGKAAKIEGRSIGEGFAALVGRWKVKTLDAFENRLEKWNEREIAKIRAKPKMDEAKIEAQEDKHATMVCLVERAREKGMTTVAQLQDMIRDMFEDMHDEETGKPKDPKLIILSSVHRSKGLEWPVVHILGRGEIMPSRRPMQEWQMDQEINLCYVAVTRAQEVLIDVAMPKPGDLKKSEAAIAMEKRQLDRTEKALEKEGAKLAEGYDGEVA